MLDHGAPSRERGGQPCGRSHDLPRTHRCRASHGDRAGALFLATRKPPTSLNQAMHDKPTPYVSGLGASQLDLTPEASEIHEWPTVSFWRRCRGDLVGCFRVRCPAPARRCSFARRYRTARSARKRPGLSVRRVHRQLPLSKPMIAPMDCSMAWPRTGSPGHKPSLPSCSESSSRSAFERQVSDDESVPLFNSTRPYPVAHPWPLSTSFCRKMDRSTNRRLMTRLPEWIRRCGCATRWHTTVPHLRRRAGPVPSPIVWPPPAPARRR